MYLTSCSGAAHSLGHWTRLDDGGTKQMLWQAARIGGMLAGGLLGLNLLSKLTGGDPDFNQAYMINRISGRGGLFTTAVTDGFGSLLFGSRTGSAAAATGMFGAGLYGHPAMMGMMNPYMANPYAMGALPYNPMMMGSMLWRV